MVKTYAINESELRDIISESIRRSLNEWPWGKKRQNNNEYFDESPVDTDDNNDGKLVFNIDDYDWGNPEVSDNDYDDNNDDNQSYYPSTSEVNYKIKGPFRKRSSIRNAYDQYRSGLDAVEYQHRNGRRDYSETEDDERTREMLNDETYQERLRQMQGAHQAELSRYQEQLNNQNTNYNEMVAQLQNQHQVEIENMKRAHESALNQYRMAHQASTGENWGVSDDITKKNNMVSYFNQCVNSYSQNNISTELIELALWDVLDRVTKMNVKDTPGNRVQQNNSRNVANESMRQKYAPMVKRVAKRVMNECVRRGLV